jgi:hypothetical protein
MQRAVIGSYALVAALAGALGLAFWVALEPRSTGSCNTSLLPGAYSSALIPLHLLAAVALGACVLWLSRGRYTVAAVAATGVYVVVCLIAHAAFAPAAVAGVVLGWPAAIAVPLVLGVRAWLAKGVDRFGAQVLVWTALLIVLPGHFVAAWSRGAEWFCL